MSDQQPYFSVGEEVILVSRDYPEYNGEYRVREILPKGEHFIECRVSKELIAVRVTSRFAYIFEEIISYFGKVTKMQRECVWGEPSLRKKHKPADESFEEMMTKLNKIKVEM